MSWNVAKEKDTSWFSSFIWFSMASQLWKGWSAFLDLVTRKVLRNWKETLEFTACFICITLSVEYRDHFCGSFQKSFLFYLISVKGTGSTVQLNKWFNIAKWLHILGSSEAQDEKLYENFLLTMIDKSTRLWKQNKTKKSLNHSVWKGPWELTYSNLLLKAETAIRSDQIS